MRTIQKQSEAAVGYEEQTKALEKERAERVMPGSTKKLGALRKELYKRVCTINTQR